MARTSVARETVQGKAQGTAQSTGSFPRESDCGSCRLMASRRVSEEDIAGKGGVRVHRGEGGVRVQCNRIEISTTIF